MGFDVRGPGFKTRELTILGINILYSNIISTMFLYCNNCYAQLLGCLGLCFSFFFLSFLFHFLFVISFHSFIGIITLHKTVFR